MSQNLKAIRRVTSLLSPNKNMQFCNEQIRTHPIFSPPRASATCGSARMCRRKNSVQPQRTHDAEITSLWRQSDVAMSFWRHKRIVGVCFELHSRVTLVQFRSAATSSLHRRLAILTISTRPSFSKNAFHFWEFCLQQCIRYIP